MESIVDGFGSLGAGLLHSILSGIWLFGSIWVGVKAGERRGQIVGWVVGIAVASASLMILIPSMDALKSVSCRNADDYQACVDGEYD